uniref:Zinc transporter ZupT n=1 Tax=Pyrodinium bahamense TaxID=73915 RepID=A0A7S0B0R3_9DINO
MAEEEAGTPSLDNAGIGFALVTAAGLSTAIGAAVVYIKPMVRLERKPILAAGLGFSGGVMLYVSFIEIFTKSMDSFQNDGKSPKDAYFSATLCLFCGMLMLRLIALCVHKIDAGHHNTCAEGEAEQPIRSNMGTSDIHVEMDSGVVGQGAEGAATAPTDDAPTASSAKEGAGGAGGAGVKPEDRTAEKDKQLEQMGLNTAAAIAIHNFPEGLATFVATLADPRIGATLAVAIAIHNIPEGLCVALPIYYAKNNRHIAFLWALFSGISEPIGAFIGWAVVKATGDDMNQNIYGVLFGLVAGMMIMIVLLELLPTAQ